MSTEKIKTMDELIAENKTLRSTIEELWDTIAKFENKGRGSAILHALEIVKVNKGINDVSTLINDAEQIHQYIINGKVTAE